MSGFVNRIKSWVTGDDFDEDVYSIDEEFEPERPMYNQNIQEESSMMERVGRRHQKSLKVVEHPGVQSTQVIVIEPKAFEESLEIVEHLRAKKSVILNLHLLDTAQSQRVVDFLSGATHAIDGNQQRIGDGVFIFTPNNVSISTDQAKTMDFTTEAFWKHSR
jgi:cell division inhibitor SepF